MTSMVFGNSTHVAFIEPESFDSKFGLGVVYTEPTFDVFYSRHGFCVPLSKFAYPIDTFIEAPAVNLPENFTVEETVHPFFRVYQGVVSLCKVKRLKNGELTWTSQYIHATMPGWWAVLGEEEGEVHQIREDTLMLTGFLKTNPTHAQIEDYVRSYFLGSRIRWFTYEEIERHLCERIDAYTSKE